MKIGYFADGPWSHKALELLSEEKGIEIKFIVPRYDTQDPILKKWAIKLGVPFIPTENVNSKSFLEQISLFECDLFISMSFNQILKKEIIELPPKGFINCHAGNLPFYRGRNPLNWVLINDESEFGFTVHYVDEGIDTGDIILQKQYAISDDDNYKTLLDRAINQCPLILLEAVKLIQSDSLKPVKQNTIHSIGTYFGRRIEGDEYIDFSRTARYLFNFIRAITAPGPGARCYVNGVEIVILESRLIEDAPEYISTCGEVIGRTSLGNVVKVGDSTILITKYAKVLDNEIQEVEIPKFRIGTRLK